MNEDDDISTGPPSNTDPLIEVNPLDQIEFDLPVSVEFPPSELQARLELPTTIKNYTDAAGNETQARLDPITAAGVERVWTETDEMANVVEGSTLGLVDPTGGQLNVESSSSDTRGQG